MARPLLVLILSALTFTAGPPALAADAAPAPPTALTDEGVRAWIAANGIDTRNWAQFGFDERGVTFIRPDFKLEARNGFIDMPQRAELFRTVTPPGVGPIRSLMVVMRTDCAGSRRRTVMGRYFSRNNLEGDMTSQDGPNGDWVALEPQAGMDAYLLSLCKASASGAPFPAPPH